MSYFELMQEEPEIFILLLLISLLITLLGYGAFPIIFAKSRKTQISKKKYKRLCFGINIIALFFFWFINGEVSTGAAYLLWTSVFSSLGINILSKKGLLPNSDYEDSDYLEEDPNRSIQCKSCGYTAKKLFAACPKCGKYEKQYVYLNEDAENSTTKN